MASHGYTEVQRGTETWPGLSQVEALRLSERGALPPACGHKVILQYREASQTPLETSAGTTATNQISPLPVTPRVTLNTASDLTQSTKKEHGHD